MKDQSPQMDTQMATIARDKLEFEVENRQIEMCCSNRDVIVTRVLFELTDLAASEFLNKVEASHEEVLITSVHNVQRDI